MKTLNRTALLAYSSASKGAQRLAKALDIPLIKRDPSYSDFSANNKETVINWGNSSENLPVHLKGVTNWVNTPQAVDATIDKKSCLEILDAADVPVPAYTTLASEVMTILEGGGRVVARGDLRGMNGKGITYINKVNEFVPADLYTRFFEHEAEIRVHVAFGEVIEVHDKTAHGFQGSHTGRKYSILDGDQAMLSSIALRAVQACNLEFGAVDMLWSDEFEDCVVLEVNTAPICVNGTLDAYVEAFRNRLGTEQALLEAPKSESTGVSSAKASSAKASPKASSKASPKASSKASDVVPASDQERVEAILENEKAPEPKASPKASAKASESSPKASEPKASAKASPKASEPVIEAETEAPIVEKSSLIEDLLDKADELTTEASKLIREARAMITSVKS